MRSIFKYLLIVGIAYIVILFFSISVLVLGIMSGDSAEPFPSWINLILNILYSLCLLPSHLIAKLPYVPDNFDQGYLSPLAYATVVALFFYLRDKKKTEK